MEASHAGADGAAGGLARAILTVTLAGFGCMVAELTAVRLLAPHFGDSAYVWTNVIGVILAALAAGAWTGGRLSRRGHPRRSASRVLLLAGAWTAAVPWVAPAIGGWLLPADLPLDAAMPAMVRGSFVATALLFGPAMWWLGAVSPLLVAAVVRGGVDIGRAAGGLSAAGTLGSLAGTFAATHVLVPLLGARVTMGIAGAALAAGALLLAEPHARRGAVAALLAVALTLLLPHGSLRAPPEGQQVLAEVESRTQFLQVVREGAAGVERTSLRINEGLDSFHSLAIAGSAFTAGAYYDWHALAPLLAGDGRRPVDLRVLSIGDAAGTLRAVYAGVHPQAQVDAVDIDPATMELGDRWFAGPKAPGRRFVVDGRVFLAHADEQWHVIHVDAYAHQVYVPAHLASREFFLAAKARLRDGGVIACNVGALHADDPVLRAIGGTLASVFGHALAMQVPNSRNALLVARVGRPPEPARLGSFEFGDERLQPEDAQHWRWLVTTAATLPWRDVAGEQVLVDDRPVLDRLLADSYVGRRDAGAVLACTGSSSAAAAEVDAYAARQRRDFPAVLRAVAGSAAPTRVLREHAGDARWTLRELRSARAEYEAAMQLAADESDRERLRGKLADVTADLAPVERAEATASRNAWLQGIAVVVACLALCGALLRA